MRKGNGLSRFMNKGGWWILVYLIICVFLWPWYQYELNPDAISYYEIAQNYAHFRFGEAINAYWSPLISWLMVPLLWTGLPVTIAGKVVLMFAGAMIIRLSSLHISRFTRVKGIAIIGMATIIAVTTWFTLLYFGADLLFTCLVLWLLWLHRNRSIHPVKRAAGIGIIGAALYFTKAFGLPFFVAWLILTCLRDMVILPHKPGCKMAIRSGLIALGTFVLLALAWVLTLSLSYGKFTTGSAAKYNSNLLSPVDFTLRHPFIHSGLNEPSVQHCTSVWYDVSLVEKSWPSQPDKDSFWNSKKRVVFHNAGHLKDLLKHFTLLSAIIIVLVIMVLLHHHRKILRHNLFMPWMSAALLAGGYLLVFFELRYIWLLDYIMIYSCIMLADLFVRQIKPARMLAISTGLVFSASFIKSPVEDLIRRKHINRDIVELSEQIDQIAQGSRVASAGEYGQSLFLSFREGWRYYGDMKPLGSDSAEAQLKRFGIGYILLWYPWTDLSTYGIEAARDDTIGTQLRIIEPCLGHEQR